MFSVATVVSGFMVMFLNSFFLGGWGARGASLNFHGGACLDFSVLNHLSQY